MAAVGIDPDRALSASWNPKDLAAFVECHIEQGPRLEEEGIEIGVVSAIAGIDRATVNLQGRRDHAGTMPVALRHDAACAAAEVVLAVERLGRDGGVGTTGRVVVEPGAANIVPEHAVCGSNSAASKRPGWSEPANSSKVPWLRRVTAEACGATWSGRPLKRRP